MPDLKDLWMFQMSDAPPKLDSWQDYFVRIGRGEDHISAFLHYYEPVLNEITNRFCRKYGLEKHFADVKMAYVEALLTELKRYNLDCGVPFLQFAHRKLTDAMHIYAMSNLKGFSETSLTHYFQLRKAAYLYKTTASNKVIAVICKELNIQPKTALRLIEEVEALDTFQWYGGAQEDDEDCDIPVGKDVLGYCRTSNPEAIVIHQEQIDALWNAFNKLTAKERDIISLHLGFCMGCYRTVEPQTFDDLADLYQYTSADGVMRFYRRALKKLRDKLDKRERPTQSLG